MLAQQSSSANGVFSRVVRAAGKPMGAFSLRLRCGQWGSDNGTCLSWHMAHRLLFRAPFMASHALLRSHSAQAVRPVSRVLERARTPGVLCRWWSPSLHGAPRAPRGQYACRQERTQCCSSVSSAPPREEQDVSVGVLLEGRPLGKDRCWSAHALQALLAVYHLHVKTFE